MTGGGKCERGAMVVLTAVIIKLCIVAILQAILMVYVTFAYKEISDDQIVIIEGWKEMYFDLKKERDAW